MHSQAQRVSLAQSVIKKCNQNSVIEKCDQKAQFKSAIEKYDQQA